jgi:(p)ppGpp synthase/HD superfamily hydrolase
VSDLSLSSLQNENIMNDFTQRTGTRRRRRTVLISSAVALLLAQQINPAESFHAAPAVQSSSATAIFFRNDHAREAAALTTQSILSTAASPAFTTTAVTANKLPTWLSVSRSHLAQANKQALQNAMKESFFTESESLKLLYAIEVATKGDRNKVAGAAEFCLILVETMEMGFTALVAAAYHYAACVTARENDGIWQPLDDTTAASLEIFGTHVCTIVNDAARLKKLEVVASSVMQQDAGSRVRPDGKDAENLRKLLMSETRDWRALAIRSASCLFRLRGLSNFGMALRTPEAARTAREALTIYAPLASRLGMHRLKNELEGAAFGILYPRQYQMVHDLTHQHLAGHNDIGASMKQVLETVQQDMTIMLKNDPEFTRLVDDFSVTARVKEPYSLWKKMLRSGYKQILEVPDALALRIVLVSKELTPDEDVEVTRARERALCYYAQRLCTDRWKPVANNPRFKDYVESPKKNGYQSLHYTANTECHGQKWTVEIQVRSGEMHQVAEYGLASHWDYKAQSTQKKDKGTVIINSSAAYLHNVQQWHWQHHGGSTGGVASPASDERADIWQSRMRSDLTRERTQRLNPYIQALTAAQSDLTRDYVFVFLSQECSSESKVLALPAGACVMDALRRINLMPAGKDPLVLNGNAVHITRQLNNGDVLAVPAAVCS